MPTNNSINSQDPIQVSKGGTGVPTLTTANGILAAGTTATGAIQNIGTGSAGEVLTSNGAGALPSFQAPPPTPGLVHLHTITFNNTASSYDLTPYLTGSGYTSFEFYLSQVPLDTTAGGANFEVSTDGGATFITSGYQGFFLLYEYGVGNLAPQAGFKINVTSYLPGFDGGGTNVGFQSGTTRVDGWLNPMGVCSSTRSNVAATNPQRPTDFIGIGQYLGSAVNGLRITKPTNFTAGTLSIYGITK